MLTSQGKATGAWRPTILLFMALLSACALGPPRAKEGMALIEGVYIRGEGRIGTVGRIFAVRRDDNRETLKLGAYSHRLDVPPGNYTVKYICHLTTDRDYRQFIARNQHLVKTEAVTLAPGDILYARAVSAAEMTVSGMKPTLGRAWCDSSLRIAKGR